jgi:hypothetical protein
MFRELATQLSIVPLGMNKVRCKCRSSIAVVWRERVLANGGLLEVHLGACQRAVVDFMFAATSVLGICDLLATYQPLAAKD